MLKSTIICEDPSISACTVCVILYDYDYDVILSNILGQGRSKDLCTYCKTAYVDSISNGTSFVPFSWSWLEHDVVC
jgi:hypothetical protein